MKERLVLFLPGIDFMITRTILIFFVFLLIGCDNCDDTDCPVNVRLNFTPENAHGTPFYSLSDSIFNLDSLYIVNISNGESDTIEYFITGGEDALDIIIPAYEDQLTLLIRYDNTFSDTMKVIYDSKEDKCCGKRTIDYRLFLNDTLFCSNCYYETVTIQYN